MSKHLKLKYYCFDLDDNLLYLPTIIHLDKKVNGRWVKYSVSTKIYSKLKIDGIKYRYRKDNPDIAFSEFSDCGERKRNALIYDAVQSLEKRNFANSWDKFIECLINGNIFSIITARSHSPNVIRKFVEFVVYNYLTDEQRKEMILNLEYFNTIFNTKTSDPIKSYLDKCYYMGVTSKWFIKRFKLDKNNHSNVEYGKEVAMKYFTKKIDKFSRNVSGSISLGFSDDNKTNLDKIESFMKTYVLKKYDYMNCIIYDTSKKNKTVKKIIVQ